VGQHVSTRQKSAVVEPVATCQDSRKGWERKDLHPVSHKRYDLITHITLFLSSAPIFQWVILGPGAGGGTRLCCCSLLKACGWWSGEVLWEGRERERERVCVCVCAPRGAPLGNGLESVLWFLFHPFVDRLLTYLMVLLDEKAITPSRSIVCTHACMYVCTVVVLRGQVLLYSGYLFSDAIGCRSVHLLATFFLFIFLKCWFFCFRSSSCTDRLLDWYATKYEGHAA
jgi:hypothetical protein